MFNKIIYINIIIKITMKKVKYFNIFKLNRIYYFLLIQDICIKLISNINVFKLNI